MGILLERLCPKLAFEFWFGSEIGKGYLKLWSHMGLNKLAVQPAPFFWEYPLPHIVTRRNGHNITKKSRVLNQSGKRVKLVADSKFL